MKPQIRNTSATGKRDALKLGKDIDLDVYSRVVFSLYGVLCHLGCAWLRLLLLLLIGHFGGQNLDVLRVRGLERAGRWQENEKLSPLVRGRDDLDYVIHGSRADCPDLDMGVLRIGQLTCQMAQINEQECTSKRNSWSLRQIITNIFLADRYRGDEHLK